MLAVMPPDLRQLTPREKAIVSKYRAQHGGVLAPTRSVQGSAGGIGYPIIGLSLAGGSEPRQSLPGSFAGEQFAMLFQRPASIRCGRGRDASPHQ
jgi:hypothetical protein